MILYYDYCNHLLNSFSLCAWSIDNCDDNLRFVDTADEEIAINNNNNNNTISKEITTVLTQEWSNKATRQ